MKSLSKKRITTKIARVWLDTVLNPIITGLEETKYYLSNKAFTWNRTYRDLVNIKKLDNYFDSVYYPNFKQLIKIDFPELENLTNEYNTKRELLNNCCNVLFNSLVSNKEFEQLIYKNIEKYTMLSEITQSNFKYLNDKNTLEWVAVFLINNQRELDYSNIFKVIWDNEKDDFFKLLNSNSISDYYVDLIKESDEFEIIVDSTYHNIEDYRDLLSLNSGVPIVDKI